MRHLALRTFSVLAATAFAAGVAEAQVGLTSNTAQVSINATKNSTLTVAINSGATQNLGTMTDGAVNNFPAPVNVTTTWDLNAGTNIHLMGWFATPASALVSGGNSITSSLVKASVNGGAYNAFIQNAVGGVGSAGGSLTLLTQSAATLAGTRTDDIALQIDLSAAPALVPGTYSGTLNLQAVVQ
jgi:hypothetical protein